MLTAPPTNADDAIAGLLAEPSLAALVTAHRVMEPRPARHAPWPVALDARIIAALRGRGIEAPYTHQAAAFDAASAGRNVVVVTPTASGKTLCYNLPVLDAVAKNDAARALYLFPTTRSGSSSSRTSSTSSSTNCTPTAGCSAATSPT